MRDIYRSLYLLETPIVVTGLETAELIKYASNAFLATKISYINEIANLCEKVGADVRVVAKAMGLDQRIGSKFLHPGIGYGGSCFPKDTEALVKIAEEAGVEMRIVAAAVDVNRERADMAVQKLTRALGDLRGRTICLLGLAFKPNTDDVREAPALKIHKALVQAGAQVRAFDPVAMERVRALDLDITLCSNAYEAMQGCDALVLVTEWNEFRTLDLQRAKSILKQPIVVDCRNMYARDRMQEVGFRYDCYGS